MLTSKNIYRDKAIYALVMLIAIAFGFTIAYEKLIYMGIILGPFLINLSIKRPIIFPFGLYVALLPFDSLLSIIGTAQGATLTKLLGVMTIFVFLLNGIYYKNLKRPDFAVVWWTLFVVYGVSSFLWAIEPDRVFSVIPTFVGLFVLYFVSSMYKLNRNDFNTLKWFIIIGGVMSSLYVIYNYSQVTQYSDEAVRITMKAGARRDDPNRYSFSLLIPVACAIQIMMTHKKIQKIICGCCLIIILFGIIITGSRGSMLGVGAILITYALFSRRRVAFVAVLIMISAILLYFIPDFYFNRWSGVIDGGGSGRTAIWQAGINALKVYGLYGAGLNNFPNAYNQFMNTTSYLFSKSSTAPHNIGVGYSVELGIIGMLFMIAAIITHYHAIKSKLSSSISNIIMLKASFWAILVSSMFLDTLMLKSFWLLWMLIMINHNLMKTEKMRNGYLNS